MSLRTFAEKGPDADLLRAMTGLTSVARLLMDFVEFTQKTRLAGHEPADA